MVREEDIPVFILAGGFVPEDDEKIQHRNPDKMTTMYFPAPNKHGNYKVTVGTRAARHFEDMGAIEYQEELKPYQEPKKTKKAKK